MRPSRTQKWAPSCLYPPQHAPQVTPGPLQGCSSVQYQERGPGLGHRDALAGPWPQGPLVADLPAACTDARPPASSSVPLPLLWPELSRNAPDRGHNPPAIGRAGQARPASSHFHARDSERGRAGSEDEGGRAAQAESGPSSYHHTEGNPPAPRKKSRAVTSSRKPA